MPQFIYVIAWGSHLGGFAFPSKAAVRKFINEVPPAQRSRYQYKRVVIAFSFWSL